MSTTEMCTTDCMHPESSKDRMLYEQQSGKLLQVGLGILLGFSAIQYLRFFIELPVDDVCFLFVGLALLLLVLPVSNRPRLRIFLGRRMILWASLGLGWYLIVSIISFLKFHRDVFVKSADPFISIAVNALLALPITLIVMYLITDRRNPQASIPKWSMLMLLFGLFGMPYNTQLGQLPLCALGFVIAFYAGFLTGNPKTLFSVMTITGAGMLAFGLRRYLMLTPASAWGHARFATADPWGFHGVIPTNLLAQYLIIILAASTALLSYLSRWARIPLKLIIAFIVLCLLLTQSRGAMVGLFAMLGTYLILIKRGSLTKRYKIIILILSAVLLIQVIYVSMGRSEGRIYLAKLGYSLFLRSPFIGNGIHSWHFSLARPDPIFVDCHNSIVEIMCSTGLVGLLIVCVLIYGLMAQYRGLYTTLHDDKHKSAFTVCAAGIVGYFITSIFHINFWLQYVTPAVPALLGIWWGIAASQDEKIAAPTKPQNCIHRLGRLLAVVLSLVLIALVSSHILPTKNQAGLLSIARTRYYDSDSHVGQRPVTSLDKSSVVRCR